MRSICLLIAAVVILSLVGGCTYYEHDHHYHYRDELAYRDYDGPYYHHHHHYRDYDRCD
jgi:hypothetical protein